MINALITFLKYVFLCVAGVGIVQSTAHFSRVMAVAPLVNTSSLTTATQPSTEKHIILTSDGTLHAFINTGTQATTCSGTPAGLTWMYSTNGGTSWSCGANLNTAITLFASVTF